MEVAWEKLSSVEKTERRFATWLSPRGVQFVTPEAEATYKARVTRFKDAIQLQKTPDRVPVSPSIGSFAAHYLGFTEHDLMYDPDKAIAAAERCTLDFEPDTRVGAGLPGAVFDALDYRLYRWPGHEIAPDQPVQYIEGEYMKAEEYDALIDDPSDFWLRTYLPRTMGALQPLTALSTLVNLFEIPTVSFNVSRYGLPEVQAALEKLMEAGRAALKWQQKIGPAGRRLEAMGFPGQAGALTKAPFDMIGDTLRGTRGIMLDMFRRPAKLLEALNRITPLMIRMAVAGPYGGGSPFVHIPLHKGADGFMSDEQFKTFYWPTLRKLIAGLVAEGHVPRLFAEGGYNSRLEVIRDDLTKGQIVWHFDRTDMARAKEVLGDVACLMGNVPVSLMQTGTPADVTAYCRELIATVGKGGGFILTTGAGIDRGKPENLRAMIDAAKEYGVY